MNAGGNPIFVLTLLSSPSNCKPPVYTHHNPHMDERRKLIEAAKAKLNAFSQKISNVQRGAKASGANAYNNYSSGINKIGKYLEPLEEKTTRKLIGQPLEAMAISRMSPQQRSSYRPVALTSPTLKGQLKDVGQGALTTAETSLVGTGAGLKSLVGLTVFDLGLSTAFDGSLGKDIVNSINYGKPLFNNYRNTLSEVGERIPGNIPKAGLYGQTNKLADIVTNKYGITSRAAKSLVTGITNIGEDYTTYAAGITDKPTFKSNTMGFALPFLTDKITSQEVRKDLDPIIQDETGTFAGGSAVSLRGLGGDELNKELQKKNAFSNVKDKGLRFFVSDKQANLKRQGLKNATERGFGTLDEILNHPKLFKEYPQAKNINVQFDPNMTARGSYDEVSGVIKLNPNNINFEQLGTILHENQHFIQGVEGFAKGGNPSTFTQQKEAELARDALMFRRELDKLPKGLDMSAKHNIVYQRYSDAGMRDWIPSAEAREVAMDMNQNTSDLENIVKYYGLDKNTTPSSSKKMYDRLQGEAEARAVQGARGLTQNEGKGRDLLAEQLQKEGIKPEELIVRGGRGQSFNADPLIEEAKKYKSAEEFIKAQGETLYHGTTAEGVTELKPGGITGKMGEKSVPGISVTPDYGTASYYSKVNGIQVYSPKEVYSKGNILKVDTFNDLKSSLGINDWSGSTRARVPEILKSKGYDGFSVSRGYGDTGEIVITNPEVLKTKQQLTDIYNQAKGGVMEDAVTPNPLELLPPPKEQKLLSGGILEAKTNAQAKKLYKQTGKTPTTNFHKEYKRVIRLGGDTPPSEWDINQMKDIGNLAKGFKDIYRNFKTVFGAQFPAIKNKILDPFDSAKGDFVDMQAQYLDDLDENIVSGLNIKKGSKESALVQKFGEKKITLEELQDSSKDWQKIIDADKYFRMKYDELIDAVNNTRKQIYPNSPEKLIQKRQDYYRHFKEMNEGLGAITNIFGTPASIDPNLAGISDFTTPKSKFLSIAQQRTGDRTEYDAVGGYLNYLRQATYATHMDPQIEKFRKLREQLVTMTEQGNVDDIEVGKLNNFIEYLNDYANALAGKTTPIDRAIQKYIPGGRTAFKALGWLNSRVKANVIVGNLSSSIAQVFNTPQALADMGGTNYTKGTGMALANILNDNSVIKESTFIKERYFNDYAKFDVGLLNNLKKFASWVTGVTDEVATKNIWFGYYQKGLGEAVQNPVKFADDATRRMVAGRGVGEVPITQTEKTFQLFAPFQVEVANLWNVFGDWANEGGPTFASKMMKYSVAAFLMNKAAKEIRGSDVTFDPINATIEGAQALKEEEDKKIGAMKFGGRILGEVLSNVPLGQTAAATYPEYGFKVGDTQYPTREALFGEGDPTKYGSGLLINKGLQDPLYKILSPFGGAQMKKTLDGQKAINRGFSQTESGRVRYPIKGTTSNKIKGALFGQYAVDEGQTYFDTKETPLGPTQSEKFKQEIDQEGYYKDVMDKRERNRLKEKAKQEGDIDTLRKVGAFEAKELPIPKTQEQFNRVYNQALKDVEANQRKIDDLPYSNVDDFDAKYKKMDFEEKIAYSQALVERLSKDAPEMASAAEYYNLTRQTNEIKQSLIGEKIQTYGDNQRMDMLKELAGMRRLAGDRMLLSDEIISSLVKDGTLTKNEGNQLKSLKIDENGQVKVKVTGRGKSAKLKKVKFVPINAVSRNKIKFENPSKFTLQAPTSLKAGSISTPKIDLPKLKVSRPESPKFKVKFNL